MLRAALLGAAANRRLARFVTRHGMKLGARRFVAGESLREFFDVARALNDRGFRVAGTMLGEAIEKREDAASVTNDYLEMLAEIARQQLRANVALKLTHLGLVIDESAARDNLALIVKRARELSNFIRIDMEQSAFVDATLEIYGKLRSAGFDNLGVVLQSYLMRSENDLRGLLALAPNVRLVKGAYLEPPSVAFRSKRDVDANFIRLLELSLRGTGFTAIATHDERIIEHAARFVRDRGIDAQRFEFQMLYGVRPRLQADLLARGYAVRLAVPFGSQWYPYLMRRLAERPANLWFFVRNLWRS